MRPTNFAGRVKRSTILQISLQRKRDCFRQLIELPLSEILSANQPLHYYAYKPLLCPLSKPVSHDLWCKVQDLIPITL